MASYCCCTIKSIIPTRVIHKQIDKKKRKKSHTCYRCRAQIGRKDREKHFGYPSCPGLSSTVQPSSPTTVTPKPALCVKNIGICNMKFSPYRFKHCRESRRNPCRRSVPAAVRVTPQNFQIFSPNAPRVCDRTTPPSSSNTYAAARKSQVYSLDPTQNCF